MSNRQSLLERRDRGFSLSQLTQCASFDCRALGESTSACLSRVCANGIPGTSTRRTTMKPGIGMPTRRGHRILENCWEMMLSVLQAFSSILCATMKLWVLWFASGFLRLDVFHADLTHNNGCLRTTGALSSPSTLPKRPQRNSSSVLDHS